MGTNWDMIGGVATVMGVIVAATGLWYAGKQLHDSRAIAKADFLLRLDERFDQHNDIRVRLYGGKWKETDDHAQMAALVSYMGLFERIKILVDGGTIDISTVDRLYGSRLAQIVRHAWIVNKKLVGHKPGWADFVELCRAVAERRKKEGRKYAGTLERAVEAVDIGKPLL
jgi:hypothetical protein